MSREFASGCRGGLLFSNNVVVRGVHGVGFDFFRSGQLLILA